MPLTPNLQPVRVVASIGAALLLMTLSAVADDDPASPTETPTQSVEPVISERPSTPAATELATVAEQAEPAPPDAPAAKPDSSDLPDSGNLI
ncbi:MAG: hypothetical protein WBG92_21495, partial [Thiohalocapsa sp.]